MARADRLLTVKEVAQILRVSAATIWRNTKRGSLPEPIRIDGRTWWIEAEILDVIEKQKAARKTPVPGAQKSPDKKRTRVRLEAA
jgi:excisionase family DNA binding protein